MDENKKPVPSVNDAATKVFDANDIFKDNAAPAADPTNDGKAEEKKPDEVPPVKTEEKPTGPKPSESFPEKGKDEDDASYNIREQLKLAQQARDSATTPEEKSTYVERMKELRKSLVDMAPPKVDIAPDSLPKDLTDAELENVKANLKKLGYVSGEDVQNIMKKEIMNSRADEIVEGHSQVWQDFYKSRPDLIGHPDAKAIRDTLEGYVWNNFRVGLETSKTQLNDFIQTAATRFFPKVNKSANARNAQDKVDVMNISGNSKGDAGTGDKKGLDENSEKSLRESGWSDADIKSFG